ncbi:MAG: competence/damage-inducible protein A [Alphaproteobacteria bacterium]|nr:competence/damage-inducible protein A [Alphaproteobacteria bacterium]
MSDTVTAAVLLIGNELLSGRTQDANLHFLATRLGQLGIELREARVVVDEEDAIVAALNALRATYDYVFTTGGIGPTHDDITADSVGKAFGIPVRHDPKAVKLLEDSYRGRGMELNEARLRMARTPEGAELVLNSISAAPGFRIGNTFVLAGVPSIMRAMFESLAPTLRTGPKVATRTIAVYLPEGTLAARFRALQEAYPTVVMGSYPFYRDERYGADLVLRSTDRAQLDAAAAELKTTLVDLGGDPIEASA